MASVLVFSTLLPDIETILVGLFMRLHLRLAFMCSDNTACKHVKQSSYSLT